MSISLVQAVGNGSTSLAYSSTNTAGNLLIAVARGSTSVSFSDSQSNNWQQASGINNVGKGVVIWYAANCKSGANTVTLTGASAEGFAIAEFSGLAIINVVDQINSSTGVINPYAAGAVTITDADELLIGAVSNETANGLTDTPSGGFTDFGNEGGNIFGAYLIVSSSGSYSYGGSLSNAATLWAAAVATFIGASQPSPPPTGNGWLNTQHDFANKKGVEW